jgi:hypothetical protein
MSVESAAVEVLYAMQPKRPTIDQYEQELQERGRITPAVQESFDKARRVRAAHKVVFYIAGGLTGMSEEVKQRYADTSELIDTISTPEVPMFGYAPHLHGTDPVKHPDVSPEEVRDIDYLWAAIIPDAHLNFMDPLAHGNAIEAGWAEMHNIPSVQIASEGLVLSRLVRGLHNTVAVIRYEDFAADGLVHAQQFLQEVHDKHPAA